MEHVKIVLSTQDQVKTGNNVNKMYVMKDKDYN